MLLEFLARLMSFDFVWIVDLVFGNLHWVFAIAFFVIIAEKGKKPVWHFLVMMGFLYAFLDVMEMGGWVLLPMIILVPLELVIGLYFREGSWPQRNFVKLVTVLIFALSFVHTFLFTLPGG
jgi:hypothetical protein